jgi:hypothetical protein
LKIIYYSIGLDLSGFWPSPYPSFMRQETRVGSIGRSVKRDKWASLAKVYTLDTEMQTGLVRNRKENCLSGRKSSDKIHAFIPLMTITIVPIINVLTPFLFP